jgi:SOUL heme-binding protein
MTKRRKTIYVGLAVIIAILAIAAAAAGPIMSRVEQPDYKVTRTDGAIEIRSYGPMIAAEAEVKGERKAAINEGFRLIAAYIFGANTPNAKIAMTAPVQQQSSQKIAMTAPVTQQTADDSWTVRFIMPSNWTLETLPVPNDARVTLKPVPAKRILVILFSGTASDSLIQTKTDELRRYAAAKKLATVGEPLLAFYNPPWTLPFLRRNEIMLELAAGG